MLRLQLPDGVPAGIEVFHLALDVDAPVDGSDWRLLSADEQVRALRYSRHADTIRFVRTRSDLRRLLAERLGLRPAELAFTVNRFGKPSLAAGISQNAAWRFNVSHSGGHALIALSQRREVGVDIERSDQALDLPGIERQMLSATERRLDRKERPDVLDCWSAKEAALKALGLGMAEHLQTLSVRWPAMRGAADGAGANRYRLDHGRADWPELEAWRLAAPAGYTAALAWAETSAEELS